ncbi:MAG TPA: DUF1801 domain-containing protein [Candidatus Limnocylindria bacterium]|nr:DUF1801 domain-containing protein [Candidatus Limnocylindria bacterium]
MPPKKTAKKTLPKRAKTTGGLTAEERAALRETMLERKGQGEGEAAVLAKVATMTPADRTLAQRIHAIVRASAPELTPKTWYGMPAYANKAGKVVCFFQDAAKFKARYATFGFSDEAHLDDGNTWPTSFALTKLTPADEAKITALVKKAVS